MRRKNRKNSKKNSTGYFLKIINALEQRVNNIETKLVSYEFDKLKENLRDGEWDLLPGRKVDFSWDKLVDSWIEILPTVGDKIPSAYRIWQSSNRYLKSGLLDRADRCERLNYLFHNSYIPASLELNGEVIFSYGGIGVIVHKDADIGYGVTIGANVTIGGNGSKTRIDTRTDKITTVPKIGTLTVIGAGANITGGIEVGACSIIAPNAVLTSSIGPGSIVAGIPAKEIGKITIYNALRYKQKFLIARNMSDEEYMDLVKKYL
ncbi:hypothetical protein KRX11_02670 [Pasteurellaceae bacterium TAE3-ERU1]|nr:hypothetical protein [Pasteurellaceae bacterium TAE3-ERU1]